jgi:hypothetical protein
VRIPNVTGQGHDVKVSFVGRNNKTLTTDDNLLYPVPAIGESVLVATDDDLFSNVFIISTRGEFLTDPLIFSNKSFLFDPADQHMRIGIPTGNQVIHMDAQDGLWIGNQTATLAPFHVGLDGILHATGAQITGTITVNVGGTIGGFTIGTDRLTAGTGTHAVGISSDGAIPFYAGNAVGASAGFQVSAVGNVTLSTNIKFVESYATPNQAASISFLPSTGTTTKGLQLTNYTGESLQLYQGNLDLTMPIVVGSSWTANGSRYLFKSTTGVGVLDMQRVGWITDSSGQPGLFGRWLGYTPAAEWGATFTGGGSTTTPSTGKYMLMGKTCRFEVYISVTGGVSGTLRFQLPLDAYEIGGNTGQVVGAWIGLNSGVGRRTGLVYVSSTAPSICSCDTASGGYVVPITDSVPWTWINSHSIVITGEYQTV